VLLAVDDHEESCLTKLKCFSDFDVEWMEECILFGVVLFENQIAANSFLLELHDLTEVIAFAHFLFVEMVMVVSSLLMGDKAFFLLGDVCFLGDPAILAMLAKPTMMTRRAEVAKTCMMMMPQEKL
jgi:uncharacterized iron-regulated membrane protein